MMHAAKSSRSMSHQYKKIPVKPESDSEDDEAILYAASSLNKHGRGKNSQHEFGVGVYDYGRDLDLPLVHKLPEKKDREILVRGQHEGLKSFCTVFCVILLLIMAVGAAIGIIVLANTNYFSSSSSLPSSLYPEPSCTPIPNARVQPCSTQSQPQVPETELPKEPTQPPPVSSNEPTQPPVSSNEPTQPVSSNEPTQPVSSNEPTQPPPVSSNEPTQPVSSNEPTQPVSSNEPTQPVSSNEPTQPPVSSNEPTQPPVSSNDPTQPPVSSNEPTQPQASSNEPTQPPSPVSDNSLPTIEMTAEDTHTQTTATSLSNEEGASVGDDKPISPSSPEPSCSPLPTPLPNMEIQPCKDKEAPPPALPTVHSITTGSDHPITPPPSDHPTTPPSSDHPTTPPPSDHPTTPPPPSPSSHPTAPTPPSSPEHRLRWERTFSPAITESSTQQFDLNGDGRDEIIVVEDFSVCTVRVHVLDSRDGSTMWEREVQFPVFAVRCVLDVNEDGTPDCLLSGRTGGLSVLDGTNGQLLWAVDRSIVFPTYNIFFPLLLPDMNGDGVDDIVNIHGGDSKYSAGEHDRSPAFLVAVSGKTGEKLIDPIPMPDGHESYISPILFKLNGKREFILFGSGGETVGGSLWALEVRSLRMKVMFTKTRKITSKEKDYEINLNDTYHACLLDVNEVELHRPVFNASQFNLSRVMETTNVVHSQCPIWADKRALWNDFNVCLYEILRSGSPKGVVLPPVLVDMTGDGVYDLVVSMFEGRTLVLDGVDATTVVWEANYPGTESYSLPAPLFYTTDNTPDLIIRTNVGEWSDYNRSTIRVLDGSNGQLLWKFDSAHSGMMSAISLASNTHGRDTLIFIAIGTANSSAPDLERRRRRRGAEFQAEEPLDGFQGEAEEMPDDDGDDDDNEDGVHEDQFEYKQDISVVGLDPDPPNLWVSTPDDPLPDDVTDVEAMLKYCGRTMTDSIASVFMVTREMIESGMEPIPLVSYKPYIFINGQTANLNHTHYERRKRHGPGMHSQDERPSNHELDMIERRDLRCDHISNPTQIFTTPLLGDFDQDGRLDITYNIVWSASEYTPPRYLLAASDLESLFEEAYGTEILGFDNFLPLEDQPWTKYMGAEGNNVFRLPKG